MSPVAGAVLLAELEAAAAASQQAEAQLRKRMEEEIARLERQRAFAYRRLNLMRAVAEGVAPAQNEETAIAGGLAVVRAQAGWDSDSDSRSETLSRFTPVVRATFTSISSPEAGAPAAEVVKVLAAFEAWYETTYRRPFWALFDREVEELPLVER
jgi:hypothetical protein